MEIGAAHAAVAHADEDFVFGGVRSGNVGKDERILFNQRGHAKESSFHADWMLADIVHDLSALGFFQDQVGLAAEARKCQIGGMVAAHAVNASTGRCGGRA